MDKETVYQLQKRIGISPDLIIREEYEMLILKTLFESDLGSYFIFKGGTALRLAYGSKRFSEDLDFNIMKKPDLKKLKDLFYNLTKTYKEITLTEFINKRNTIFALFKISIEELTYPFSIKFEASTRNYNWEKKKDYDLIMLKSQMINLTLLVQVSSLERIKKDKLSIVPKRVRDIYDIWYIDQILRKHSEMDYSGFDKKTVKREINKLIPLQERKVIEKWL
jgi:predicted nucleotidyltransferase component of viral defense system